MSWILVMVLISGQNTKDLEASNIRGFQTKAECLQAGNTLMHTYRKHMKDTNLLMVCIEEGK